MPATVSAPSQTQTLQDQLSTSPEVGMSAAALAALQTFMAESQALEEMAAAYLAASELEAEAKAEAAADAEKAEAEKKDKSLMDAFPEQWGMSQFWNDEDTARRLAREAVDQANGGTIVCVSSPSVFLMLKVSTSRRGASGAKQGRKTGCRV